MLAAVETHSAADAVAITDTLGHTWHQVNSYSADGGVRTVSLWYAYANNTAACTVTGTPGNAANSCSIAILEYHGVVSSSPVAGTNTNFDNSMAFTTGTVGGLGLNNLLLGVFAQSNTVLQAFAAGSGFTKRTSLQCTFDHGGIHVVDKLNVSVDTAATGTLGGGGDDYVALGAGFKPG